MPLPKRCIVLLLVTLTACSSAPVQHKNRKTPPPMPVVSPQADTNKNDPYYLDDGPATKPVDVASIPEPVPVDEPELPRANQPYKVEGEVVTPERGKRAYTARGVASWYGKRFHGRKTASGERYNMYAFSAAHRTLPIPSYARVTNLANGRSVVVRVNDRGPFHKKRLIDLSWAAAEKLGFIHQGEAKVLVERVMPGEAARAAVDAEAITVPAPAVQAAELDSRKAYLQVASFKNPTSARALIERLQVKEHDVPLILLQSGSLYRVLFGPYDDENAARAALPALKDGLGRDVVLYRHITETASSN